MIQEEISLDELLLDESTPGSIDNTIKVFPDETKLDKNKTSGRGHRSLLKSVITRMKAWVKAELLDKSDTDHTHAIADVTDLQTALDSKVDKVAGKQLSTEDYTSAEKQKLAGLESSHFKGLYTSLAALQMAVPAGVAGDYAHVDTGAGTDAKVYIWDASDATWLMQAGDVAGETAASIKTKYESNPDTNAFTDAEKTKLADLGNMAVDAAMSDSSTNAVQNKVIKAYVDTYATNKEGYRINVTQLDNVVRLPYKGGKWNFEPVEFVKDAVSGKWQLYKVVGGTITGQTVRSLYTEINTDINAMTQTELDAGYFVQLSVSFTAGKDFGCVILKANKV